MRHRHRQRPARPRIRHKLYWHIYLTLVLALLIFAGMAALLFHTLGGPPVPPQWPVAISRLLQHSLPPASAPPAVQQQALQDIAGDLDMAISLNAANGQVLAQLGPRLRVSPEEEAPRGPVRSYRLADGRVLHVGRPPHPPLSVPLLSALAILAVAVAIAAWPLSRRLTRSMDRLISRIDALGEGDFQTPLPLEGPAEVSLLATRFNAAAQRIHALLHAHKELLAHASHELRSPLARLRMVSTLLADRAPDALRTELEQNITELDELVEEILLLSRLDARPQPARMDSVNLTALCTELAAQYQASVTLANLHCQGDARMLRRLVRNLLENAQRYGAPPITVGLLEQDGRAVLQVCDAGPGIPPDAQLRLFEPFYRPPGAAEGDGGHGLGLALVDRIARHHGGQVEYRQQGSGGSCFTVYLPLTGPRQS
ncbi:sensor histidine kinase [Leeia sp.]|uniref:sensor histidine kinase n=1 Tax=Leeia sp. TaxID=2884678 RepID=UPI0035B0B675